MKNSGLFRLARRSLIAAAVAALPYGAWAQGATTPAERGRVLFEKNCAVCHGADGRADTPVGRLLKPRPRNLADPVDMARVSLDRMYRSIKEGRPGTAMAAWKDVLSETEIGDITDYVRNFAASKNIPAANLSLDVGRRIYERECAYCHGADGSANTDVAARLVPPPRNFTDPIAMARVDDGRMYLAIYRGRPGTAMGGHGELLSGPEIIDVMRYIRTLVKPLPAGMTAAHLDARVGEQIYLQYCVSCHGEKGDGRSAVGVHLTPAPRDFTRAAEMAARPDDAMAASITRGVPGTGMAPWDGVLNKEEVRRVLFFIRQTFPRS